MRDSIYRSNRIRRGTRVIALAQVSHVFDCPACEYVMTATTQEGAETLRRVHVRITHPALLADLLWQESPLGLLEPP